MKTIQSIDELEAEAKAARERLAAAKRTAGLTRDKHITLVVNDTERAQIQADAKAAGLKTNVYIRQKLGLTS